MSDKKIKIIQITHDLRIGGLQRIVVDICSYINKSIFDISICCLRDLGEFQRELRKQGVTVYRIPTPGGNGIDYLSFLKLYNLIKRKEIDILHTHNTYPFIDGTLAGKMAGIPVLIHTDHARDFPDKKRYMLTERILSSFVNKIVAVSEATKLKLVHYEKINSDKIIVIWNGIDPEKFKNEINTIEKKKQLGVVDRYPILGLGVRLSKQKGITYLLKAISKIIKEFPQLLLLIAGYGEEENTLKQETSKLGIDYYVRFLGPRLDMHEILAILDLYVLPSVWEGMPLVILEAMAAKKPIVATAVDGTKEVVIHEESGLLVPPKDCNALVTAILRILRNPNFAAYISENAGRRFKEHFTVQKMVSNYEKLYLNCYNRKFSKSA